MTKKNLVIILVFMYFPFFISVQEIQNVHFEQVGNKIFVYYDLMESTENQQFEIAVYCNKGTGENWGNPLVHVTGEVGENILPGLNKIIKWDVLEEYDELVGDVRFKVEAKKITGFYGKSGTFIDLRDKQEYKWIRIGNLIWMGDNLNYSLEGSFENAGSKTPDRGRFYNMDAAIKACPDGWHLPSDKEWIILELELGMSKTEVNITGNRNSGNVGTKLKTNLGFINSFHGYYDEGTMKLAGTSCAFWSSTSLPENADNYYYRLINNISEGVVRYSIRNIKTRGLSVRCVTSDN